MADWYFDGKEDTEIPNRIYREEHWKYASKELTDILPQHYHNNYRIAYWILQYGWGPGIFLLLCVAAVYALMLKLILRIHNPMVRPYQLPALSAWQVRQFCILQEISDSSLDGLPHFLLFQKVM